MNAIRAFLVLLALSSIAFAACSPSPCAYGQGPCSSNSDCAIGLVCTNGFCNQPLSVCTNMPASWQNPQLSSNAGSPGLSPYSATMNQTAGTSSAVINASSTIYQRGWFSDWSTLGLIGVGIAIIIISIAAMVGYAFDLNEVKAFAKSEIMQAAVSIMLIFGLMALLQFLDIAAIQAVEAMDLPVSCNPSEPCYITAAKEYLNNVQSVANQFAENSLRESYNRMNLAMRGANLQFNVWFLAFAGSSIRPNAGETIQAERAGAIFETASKMIVSLYAQKYFLETIAYGIAPVFLLFGITLRTFFFTRKLGGLLLAIAIALFIVYPLTFVFAWFTLNVTVYGERSIAVSDPSCPSECTVRYPVAFYTNSSGHIIQFETTQEILRAQINESNWRNNPNYPGLVACKDLSSIGINTSVAPPACQGCPDYCREVPFPSYLLGCNITACSSCNPGCKIMRQRSDCQSKCWSEGCSRECLIDQPVENKCFYIQESSSITIVPANLSVNCSVCSSCPNWCKIVYKNADGSYELVNKNEGPCQISACLPNGTTMKNNSGSTIVGTCPIQCLYVTQMSGSDTSCDSLCKDPNTGAICPKYCRIQNLSSLQDYDYSSKVYSICTGQDFGAACSRCPNSCKIPLLPEDQTNNLSLCAPFPRSSASAVNCSSCQDYCRFVNFENYSGFSNIQTMARWSEVPAMCGGQDCSDAACGTLCKAQSTPPLCEAYNESSTQDRFCTKCPPEARIILRHTSASSGTTEFLPAFSSSIKSGCTDASCSGSCKKVLDVPNSIVEPSCQDYDLSGPDSECRHCPVECRVIFSNESWLNQTLCDIPACKSPSCNPECKANASSITPLLCLGYKGNGPVDWTKYGCHGKSSDSNDFCSSYNSPSCQGSNVNCVSATDPYTCNSIENCSWDYHECKQHSECYAGFASMDWNISIPIDQRNPPYNDRSNCQQCPENCRIVYDNGIAYTGGCGSRDLDSSNYVDCTLNSCPLGCRVTLPAPQPSPSSCLIAPSSFKTCFDCPAFCRRFNESAPPSDKAFCNPQFCSQERCIDECRLPNPPSFACEACVECPTDCLYFPPTRTDCSEVCTDEALSGPINTGPEDFIKKLPGASGKEDVKGIGLLMLPGIVLPLFCIVIVIAFIRTFSPILGGDIEIPGIGRII